MRMADRSGRQRRYFFYLSGCELPDSYVTYNIATDRLTLFIPPINPEDVVWSGLPLSPQEALAKYQLLHGLYSIALTSFIDTM
jgi:Xaa-Pro dipeptidase